MLKKLISRLQEGATPPKVDPEPLSEKSLRAADKKIVRRLAVGSVRLHRGEYSTTEDIDRERLKALEND